LIHSLKRKKKRKVASESSKSVGGSINGVPLLVGSESSGHKDGWKNWMLVHGKPKEVALNQDAKNNQNQEAIELI